MSSVSRLSNVSVPIGGPLIITEVSTMYTPFSIRCANRSMPRGAGPVALLAQDRVLRPVAQALEPEAPVAQLRDVAAEVRALAVQGQDVHPRVGELLAGALDPRLGRPGR